MWAEFILLLPLVLVNADLAPTVSSSTSSKVQCATKLASTKPKLPVKTTTSTVTVIPEIIIIFSASTPIKTVTGPTVTSTSTVPKTTTVTTTNAGVTGTFTTTTTVVSTSSVLSDFTVVSTSTVTTTVSSTTITTVPTSSGFVYIYDSTGEQNYQGAARRDRGPLRSRELHIDRRTSSGSFKYQYPTKVTCE